MFAEYLLLKKNIKFSFSLLKIFNFVIEYSVDQLLRIVTVYILFTLPYLVKYWLEEQSLISIFIRSCLALLTSPLRSSAPLYWAKKLWKQAIVTLQFPTFLALWRNLLYTSFRLSRECLVDQQFGFLQMQYFFWRLLQNKPLRGPLRLPYN